MKVLLLFLMFTTIIVTANGQTVLKIVTANKMTQDPVLHALVTVQEGDSVQKAFTWKNGEAYFTVLGKDSVRILCEHNAYNSETRVLGVRDLRRDTVKIKIAMRFNKITNIDEVIVYPAGVPVPVFQSERISVDDFEFLPDGRMLLLTYAKNARKGTELYLYNREHPSEQSLIPLGDNEMGKELIRDYRGNPHVITEKNVFGISAQGNEIFVGGLEKEYFMTYIAPIVDTTVTKYFFSNYNPDYPAFDYFTYDLVDSSYRKIAQIEDDLMMELYRSEYKWVDVRTKLWAKDMENQTGIDAEIWVGATYFTQSVYYKELYAPMFRRNDTIFLFDHYTSNMYRYDAHGNEIDSLPIYYHLQPKQSGWKKQLLQDQTTGEVYVVYEKAGRYSLQRIDLATGELKEIIPLHHKYPENILIRSNKVFYTYREFETAQKKYLYEEKFPVTYLLNTVQQGDTNVKRTE